MKKLFLIPFIYIIGQNVALADTTEPPIPVDTRMKVLIYDESDVYTIRTKYGYQTNIVFSSQEEIETISVGDRSTWQIIPAGHRLFIRPMEEGVDTNMTVITNKHSYQFDLVSLGEKSKNDNIYVARFLYPDVHASQTAIASPEPKNPPPSEPVAAPTAPVTSSEQPPSDTAHPFGVNYNYTYAGPDNLAPLQVYDDGKSTYIKYQDNGQPLPNVFVIQNGNESPVSYEVKGEYMVIDAVAGEFVLKSAGGSVHVFNEMLNPK